MLQKINVYYRGVRGPDFSARHRTELQIYN